MLKRCINVKLFTVGLCALKWIPQRETALPVDQVAMGRQGAAWCLSVKGSDEGREGDEGNIPACKNSAK